jgi:hypothetical protein
MSSAEIDNPVMTLRDGLGFWAWVKRWLVLSGGDPSSINRRHRHKWAMDL